MGIDSNGFLPITGAIGAVSSAIDLSDLSRDSVATLRDALHRYGVVVFRDQDLSPATQVEMALKFGTIYRHPLLVNKHWPDITVLDSEDTEVFGTGYVNDRSTGWHTDATFERFPPYLAVLRAVLLPDAGGDTLWASTAAAYEGLSSSMQRLLDGLEAVHDAGPIFEDAALGHRVTPSTIATHPVVSYDEYTGRKFLYVNQNYTHHIVGMSKRESTFVLSFLYEQITAPDYQMRLRWQKGTVAMWNERMTLHNGVGDYTEHRVMHRVIVAGNAALSR